MNRVGNLKTDQAAGRLIFLRLAFSFGFGEVQEPPPGKVYMVGKCDLHMVNQPSIPGISRWGNSSVAMFLGGSNKNSLAVKHK